MTVKRGLAFLSIILLALLFIFHQTIFRQIGLFLISQHLPSHADASVVLSTGVEYPYRLIEAASLYNSGLVDRIVINGNRKSEIIKHLEEQGYQPAATWYENSLRILETQGVPRDKVITVSAENAYDSISEAATVCRILQRKNILNIIITTSKSHSKRAACIWERICTGAQQIYIAPAKSDPYDPNRWWKDGRQIRWVMSEYGAWLYFIWKRH